MLKLMSPPDLIGFSMHITFVSLRFFCVELFENQVHFLVFVFVMCVVLCVVLYVVLCVVLLMSLLPWPTRPRSPAVPWLAPIWSSECKREATRASC